MRVHYWKSTHPVRDLHSSQVSRYKHEISVAATSGRLFRILDAVGSNLDGFLRTKGRNEGIHQGYPPKKEFLKLKHYSLSYCKKAD